LQSLKSLLQHHSSKASILWCSAFFIVQLSRPYLTTGKTITLIRRTFVGKVTSLLFNMLSRLVITFLPKSKHLLISCLPSPSAVEVFQILKDDAVKVLHSICQQIWKTQKWPQDWKRSVFIPIPKKQCQRMLKLPHSCTHLTL